MKIPCSGWIGASEEPDKSMLPSGLTAFTTYYDGMGGELTHLVLLSNLQRLDISLGYRHRHDFCTIAGPLPIKCPQIQLNLIPFAAALLLLLSHSSAAPLAAIPFVLQPCRDRGLHVVTLITSDSVLADL